jgi:hypothetical protein
MRRARNAEISARDQHEDVTSEGGVRCAHTGPITESTNRAADRDTDPAENDYLDISNGGVVSGAKSKNARTRRMDDFSGIFFQPAETRARRRISNQLEPVTDTRFPRRLPEASAQIGHGDSSINT